MSIIQATKPFKCLPRSGNQAAVCYSFESFFSFLFFLGGGEGRKRVVVSPFLNLEEIPSLLHTLYI